MTGHIGKFFWSRPLKGDLDEKEKRIVVLETQMHDLRERVNQQEEKYGDTEKLFFLHSEMISHQNDQFERLDHEAKSQKNHCLKYPRERQTTKRGY